MCVAECAERGRCAAMAAMGKVLGCGAGVFVRRRRLGAAAQAFSFVADVWGLRRRRFSFFADDFGLRRRRISFFADDFGLRRRRFSFFADDFGLRRRRFSFVGEVLACGAGGCVRWRRFGLRRRRLRSLVTFWAAAQAAAFVGDVLGCGAGGCRRWLPSSAAAGRDDRRRASRRGLCTAATMAIAVYGPRSERELRMRQFARSPGDCPARSGGDLRSLATLTHVAPARRRHPHPPRNPHPRCARSPSTPSPARGRG